MSNKELMKPRYKVIAQYPYSSFPNGEIIQDILNPMFLDMYPHLFQRLEWWEDRKPEDMPKYVKWIHNESKVRKVDSYLGEKGVVKFEGFDTYNKTRNYLPATEEEYNNQNNTSVSY